MTSKAAPFPPAPIVRKLAVGFGLGVIAYGLMHILDPQPAPGAPDETLRRALFVAATILIFSDLFDGITLSRPTRDLHDPSFWMLGYAHAAHWGALLFAIAWWHDTPSAVTPVVAAAFGAMMMVFHRPTDPDPAIAALYVMDQPLTAQRWGRRWYYGWPILATVIVVCTVAATSATDGWNRGYVMFQMVLLLPLMPLYRSASMISALPRLLGTALLILALLGLQPPETAAAAPDYSVSRLT